MSKKIAPTLTDLCVREWYPKDRDTVREWSEARAELKALLAVARAAERVDAMVQREQPGYALASPEDASLARALSRLSRLSEGKRR